MKYIPTIVGMLLTATATASAADGVRVEHLGANNTLVRVEAKGRYLLLPVQESADDATISVLADGKQARTIYVRLAKNKVDYMVPLPLEEYHDSKVLLNVLSSHGRSSVREAAQDVCWDTMCVTDTFNTENREAFRPAYHHTPLYGWMNDPNGMFYKDGRWHLYYQYNPFGSKWQNMTWGHSSSTDLVHWQHHPEAIYPDALGSIFSGSCVVDQDGTAGFGKDAVVALFTSAGASQVQSMAHSTDGGNTFKVYPGNPVLTLDSEARDPNMFWNEDTHEWNLVLAHPLDHEMLFFSSPDLKTWKLNSAFGHGIGCQDGVWECPDLFRLPVEGTDTYKWVLLCNINPGGPFGGSATQYFVGDFDGKTFTADTLPDGSVPTKWMDFGKDHYATVSWSNAPGGRRTVIGWMSNWQYAADVPTSQFRSANTLPREVGLFRAADGQLYTSCRPSPEVDALRGTSRTKRKLTASSKGSSFDLPELCEITFEIHPHGADSVTISLENAEAERVDMVYNVKNRSFAMDRRNSGITNFSEHFPAVTVAPVLNDDSRLCVRMFIDRSSIEIFERDGRMAMTNLVFPNKPYNRIRFSSPNGRAAVRNLAVYEIK